MFLRRNLGAGAWWAAIAEQPYGAPGIIRELLSSPSVVSVTAEAEAALAWARARPEWTDDPAPVYLASSPRDASR